MNRIKLWMCLPLVLLAGCEDLNPMKERFQNIQDPTERGLACVAAAIVIAAVLRAIFNR